MGEGNAIPTQQFKDAYYMWMEKCNTYIMTLIHIIYGRGKCNTCRTI
jgi:hypothetical protein